jgi:hypothetical protein
MILVYYLLLKYEIIVELRHEKIREVKQTNIPIHQYSETNMMKFVFNLSRIKGLYMFRALLAHPPQEALHKQHLVYCVCFTPILVQPTDITHVQYTNCHLCSTS